MATRLSLLCPRRHLPVQWHPTRRLHPLGPSRMAVITSQLCDAFFLLTVCFFLMPSTQPTLPKIMYAMSLTALIFLPFVAHQYTAYRTFCINPSAEPAPWC